MDGSDCGELERVDEGDVLEGIFGSKGEEEGESSLVCNEGEGEEDEGEEERLDKI